MGEKELQLIEESDVKAPSVEFLAPGPKVLNRLAEQPEGPPFPVERREGVEPRPEPDEEEASGQRQSDEAADDEAEKSFVEGRRSCPWGGIDSRKPSSTRDRT